MPTNENLKSDKLEAFITDATTAAWLNGTWALLSPRHVVLCCVAEEEDEVTLQSVGSSLCSPSEAHPP